MKRYGKIITGQFIRLLSLLFCTSILTFLLVTASPLDPIQQNVGQSALGSFSPEQIEKLERYWGINAAPIKRYVSWAGDFIKGDMGISLLYRREVSVVIREKLRNSIWVLASAWLLSGVIGIALGLIAGTNEGKMLDKCIRGYSVLIASTPVFWLALLLLLIFAVWLKILPIGLSVPIGMEASAVTLRDRVLHAVLPVVALSMTGISNIALHTREKVIDVMASDYILFATVRGESKASIVFRHCLRNILLPALTLQFASVSEIFGGAVLVEQIFSYPGLFQAAVTAGLGGDVPLLLGITVISAAIVFCGNFAANMLYGVVDPRMRQQEVRQ